MKIKTISKKLTEATVSTDEFGRIIINDVDLLKFVIGTSLENINLEENIACGSNGACGNAGCANVLNCKVS